MTLVQAGKTSQGRTYLLRADLVEGEPREGRSLSRDRAPAGASRGPDRRRGARARARRQGVRPHRRRPARDGSRRPAAHAAAALRHLLARRTIRRSKQILDNVIFMLWPTINPDGMRWWPTGTCSTSAATRREQPQMPYLYQEYVGHDNNRDAYMLNMIESRVMEHTWREWEPNIVYVQHQSPPFPTRIWLPPFAEPIARARAADSVGRSEHDRHGDRAGPRRTRPGRRHAHGRRLRRVVSGLHRLRRRSSRTSRRSGPRRRAAAPRRARRRSNDVPQNMRSPQALYTSPWLGGTWRLRDAVEYDETASLSVIEYAAKYKEDAALRPLSVRPRSDRKRGQTSGAVRVRHSAGPARSGRAGRAAAAAGVQRRARVATDVAGVDRRRRRIRRARG